MCNFRYSVRELMGNPVKSSRGFPEAHLILKGLQKESPRMRKAGGTLGEPGVRSPGS